MGRMRFLIRAFMFSAAFLAYSAHSSLEATNGDFVHYKAIPICEFRLKTSDDFTKTLPLQIGDNGLHFLDRGPVRYGVEVMGDFVTASRQISDGSSGPTVEGNLLLYFKLSKWTNMSEDEFSPLWHVKDDDISAKISHPTAGDVRMRILKGWRQYRFPRVRVSDTQSPTLTLKIESEILVEGDTLHVSCKLHRALVYLPR